MGVNLVKTPQEQAKDRSVLIAVLLVGFVLLVVSSAVWSMGEPARAQARADKIELTQWRDAKRQCTYMRGLHIERLEAACYREVFEKDGTIDDAVKQCKGWIAQCDTTLAIDAQREVEAKYGFSSR